ncbi:hypothetical protein [Nonomuraea endophytica]|uniref:hypothetical protein n=1 Tax=Nonomuraea endophytica TaxID=714136 RepID=UPI0037C5C028
MPLNPQPLADGFTALFDGRDGFPATTADAAKAWAALYRSYAATASAVPTLPVPAALAAGESTLASNLAHAFDTARGTAPVADALASDLDTAFLAFWSAPPVAFLLPGTPPVNGIVTTAPAGVLGPAIAATFAAGTARRSSAAEQAQALATAIDAWTRTVMVAHSPPGPSAPVFLT